MSSRKIPFGRMAAVIVVIFVLVAFNVRSVRLLRNSDFVYSNDLQVYSGTVEAIKEVEWELIDGVCTEQGRNVDSTIISDNYIHNVKIKLVNETGSRWFYADNRSYVRGDLGSASGMNIVKKGMYLSFVYGKNFMSDDYVKAMSVSDFTSSVNRGYAIFVLSPSLIVLLCSIILIDPLRDPYRKKGKGRKVIKTVCIVLTVAAANFGFLGTGIYSYLLRLQKAAATPPVRAHAPIIYIYGDEEESINVKLDIKGDLTCTYPEYDTEDGWNVTASPDGTLTDMNGDKYRYLFWEADLDMDCDMSRGYCVRGCDTEEFLDQALAELGLNETEAADFISFWLPFMSESPYNVISFQTTTYTDAAGLNVTPAPDVTVRVNMLWYMSYEYVDIEPQDLSGMNPGLTDREGLVLVEWGGEVLEWRCQRGFQTFE
ncbi:MAG: hypothetical protein J5685_00375 [Clostridiales bacterium]|nr:hypothetical protein [Clostridiales bacterium]